MMISRKTMKNGENGDDMDEGEDNASVDPPKRRKNKLCALSFLFKS